MVFWSFVRSRNQRIHSVSETKSNSVSFTSDSLECCPEVVCRVTHVGFEAVSGDQTLMTRIPVILNPIWEIIHKTSCSFLCSKVFWAVITHRSYIGKRLSRVKCSCNFEVYSFNLQVKQILAESCRFEHYVNFCFSKIYTSYILKTNFIF